MHKYEITFITKEDLKEAAVKKEIDGLDGKIISTNGLGQKQLAFQIKKETAGYYTAVLFEMEPEKVLELNRKLSLKSEIIRHLIIASRVDRIAALEQIKQGKKVTEEALAPQEETVEPFDKARGEEKPTEITKEIAPETEVVEAPAKKEKKPLDEAQGKPAKKAAAKSPEAPEEKAPEKPRFKSAKEAEAEAKKPEVSTEDRLKALDEKLDELLKE